jgi:hypothetical protein
LQRENDPAFAAAITQDVKRALVVITQDVKRALVVAAVKAKDMDALERLTSADPQLRRWAFRSLTQKRGRGRAKGDPRPSDLPDITRWCLQEAASEMEDLRNIWHKHYGMHRRSMDPQAIDIIARRWGLDRETLSNFLKNRWRRHK